VGSLLAIREQRGSETRSIHLAQVVSRNAEELADQCDKGKRAMVGVRMFEEEGARYALSTILAGKQADAQSSSGHAEPDEDKKGKGKRRSSPKNETGRTGQAPAGRREQAGGTHQPKIAQHVKQASARGAAGTRNAASNSAKVKQGRLGERTQVKLCSEGASVAEPPFEVDAVQARSRFISHSHQKRVAYWSLRLQFR
jgi:hypothetical protein